jgi:putative membrane protein
VSFLRNLLLLLVAVAMAAVGVLFALQNPDPVPLDILFMKLPERSLALWVLAALAIGGLLGMGLSLFAVLRLRARAASLRRQLARSQSQVERLKTTGLATRE